jgi:hypothetical protein
LGRGLFDSEVRTHWAVDVAFCHLERYRGVPESDMLAMILTGFDTEAILCCLKPQNESEHTGMVLEVTADARHNIH